MICDLVGSEGGVITVDLKFVQFHTMFRATDVPLGQAPLRWASKRVRGKLQSGVKSDLAGTDRALDSTINIKPAFTWVKLTPSMAAN